MYRVVDAAFVGESGGTAGHVNKIISGAASASRIGLRGTEDLGNDLSAFFTLETGIRIGTGELDACNTILNLQAFVGLKGRFGALALGRQYTPHYQAMSSVVDRFGTGYAGTSEHLFPDVGANIRTSNTVTCASPQSRGIDVQLASSTAEQCVLSAGRQYGGAIGDTWGALTVRLAYNAKKSDVVAGLSP